MNAPTPAALELQTSDDRRKWLGGSDVAAVLGCDPWKTALDIYEKKLGIAAPQPYDEERERRLRRGKMLEPLVLEMLQREHPEVRVVSTGHRFIDPLYPWAAAEIDFQWYHVDDPDRTILNGEIKTVHPFAAKNWGEIETDEVPIYYATQAMWGMGITGARKCLVVALFGADNLATYYVERDEETIAGMRQQAREFWEEHVERRRPPQPQTKDDIYRLFARTNGKPVEASDELVKMIARLKEVRQKLRALESEKDELDVAIGMQVVEAWGFSDPGSVTDDAVILKDGKKLASWKSQRGTYLDQKRLAREKPEVTEAYTVEHYYRVLR